MSSLLSKLFQVCVDVATFTIRLAFSLEPPGVCMSLCKICLLQERNVHVSYMSRQYPKYGAVAKLRRVAVHCAGRGLAGDCGLLGEPQRSDGLPNASPVCLRVPMVKSSRAGRIPLSLLQGCMYCPAVVATQSPIGVAARGRVQQQLLQHTLGNLGFGSLPCNCFHVVILS